MKAYLAATAALAAVLMGGSALAQAPAGAAPARAPPPPMKIEMLKPGLYFITGGGGNSTLRVTKAGAVLVDSKLMTDKDYADLTQLIAGVSDKPVKVVIIDNKFLGMVRQWQELFFDNRLSGVDLKGNPDFVKLAEAYGAEGYRVTRPEDLEGVLRTAFASDSPAVIDIRVKREANVYPMIPAGGTVHDMMERD